MSSAELPRIVVLGGGLSGAAAAWVLARAGCRSVTLVERGPEIGGLAGSFEREGRFYPLGYHHVLHRDRTLLWFLQELGELERVRWRRIRMLFHLGGRTYDLARPGDFLRFPLPFADKLRFARLMLRAARTEEWSRWEGRGADELIDAWGGPRVRAALFEPLTRLKFEAACSDVSAAWLGARLFYREGSAPLGYIPGTNWTRPLCTGIARLCAETGVRVRLGSAVQRLETRGGRVVAARLENGELLEADVFVSSVPTEVYARLIDRDDTSGIGSIRYTALISAVCAARERIVPDFYWMNLAGLDRSACAIFVLSALNPSIGAPGESCVNFVTHAVRERRALLELDDRELLARYLDDFRAVLGFELKPFWSQVSRVPLYSPVFARDYVNPPVRSATWDNLFFAGNYRTFPSVASTGTALASGVEAAQAILAERGVQSDVGPRIARFRLASMPRA